MLCYVRRFQVEMTEREAIEALAGQNQGVVRPRDLAVLGMDTHDLRRLVADGLLIRSGRGIYTPADYEITEAHSLVEAIQTQSKGVVCLLSALSLHQLGTQLHHQVWVAIPFGARVTANETVPMRIVVMRAPAYGAGIEIHRLEGVDVPVYSIAKTIADCFKFRNKIGLDVALEALRDALRDRRCSREEIRTYAKINRVERIMAPYMEALSR